LTGRFSIRQQRLEWVARCFDPAANVALSNPEYLSLHQMAAPDPARRSHALIRPRRFANVNLVSQRLPKLAAIRMPAHRSNRYPTSPAHATQIGFELDGVNGIALIVPPGRVGNQIVAGRLVRVQSVLVRPLRPAGAAGVARAVPRTDKQATKDKRRVSTRRAAKNILLMARPE
jgi:hypothetical protein